MIYFNCWSISTKNKKIQNKIPKGTDLDFSRQLSCLSKNVEKQHLQHFTSTQSASDLSPQNRWDVVLANIKRHIRSFFRSKPH